MSEVLQPEPGRNEKSGEVGSGEGGSEEGVGCDCCCPANLEYTCILEPANRIWLVRYNTFCMIVVVARDEVQAKERYYNWLRDNDFIGLHTAACLSDFYDLMVSEPCKGNWKLLEVGVSTLPDDKHYIDISLLNEVDNG